MRSTETEFIDLGRVVQLVKRYSLCNHCLGRVFAKYGIELSNYERGAALKTILQMYLHSKLVSREINSIDLKIIASNTGDPVAKLYEKTTGEKIVVKECYICRNKLSKKYFEELALRIGSDLLKKNASSFVLGVSISNNTVTRELEVYRTINIEISESIKNELKREIGKLISNIYGLKPDFKNPDIMVIIDFETDSYRLIVNPILLEGRYWKRGRNISQNQWIGKDSGKKYPYSLQEFLLNKLRDVFKTNSIVMHTSGGEDVDSRILGSGRLFVIEIKNPVVRKVELDNINNLLKTDLLLVKIDSFSSRVRIKYLKNESFRVAKVYRLLIYSEREIIPRELCLLEEYFKNTIVKQHTPTRVLWKRRDRVRSYRVYEIKNYYINPCVFETIIYCDRGLYVKELIHGDSGRTTPNYADYLKTKLYPLETDIVYTLPT